MNHNDKLNILVTAAHSLIFESYFLVENDDNQIIFEF